VLPDDFFGLQEGLDFDVYGEVRLRIPADGVGLGGGIREMKITTDLVIVLERAKDTFGLLAGQLEGGYLDWPAVSSAEPQVFFDYIV
jgi:hypothetical protein